MSYKTSLLLIEMIVRAALTACNPSDATEFEGFILSEDLSIVEEENQAALAAYTKFVDGESSLSMEGEITNFSDLFYYYTAGNNESGDARYDRYTIFDLNDDGITELIIRSAGTYIFTYKDGNIELLWSDEDWSWYDDMPENGEGDIVYYEDEENISQNEGDEKAEPYLSLRYLNEIQWSIYTGPHSWGYEREREAPCFPVADTSTKMLGNARFDFWVNIPDDWVAYDTSDNGDGHRIGCGNRDIDMRATGRYDVFPEETPADLDDGSIVSAFVFDSGITGWKIEKNESTIFTYLSEGRYLTFYVNYEKDPAWFKQNQDKILTIAKTLRDGV